MTKRRRDNSLLEIVPYPEIPLEDIYKKHSMWRGAHSKHTRDLFIILAAVLGATFAVVYAIQQLTRPEFWGSQMLAAMLTSGLATFAAIYQLSKLRFSTVDCFSSEILARLRILSADNSVERIVIDADRKHVELRSKQAASGTRVSGGVLEPSRENQFENFFRRSSDLGALSSVVVDHVTDFYSFHMAARDALRDLTATIETFPSEEAEIKARVVDVLFMLDLMAYSGMRALDELIETPAHQLHSRQVALSVGTRANRCLVELLPPTDHRFPEVMRRNEKYIRIVRELKRAISPGFFDRRILPPGLIPPGKEFF